MDNNNNLGLDVPGVKPGSEADIIRAQIRWVMQIDVAQETMKKDTKFEEAPRDNTGDGDASDGVGHTP